MEASDAQAQDGAVEQAAPEQSPAVDLAPLMERFDGMTSRIENLQSQFESRFSEPDQQEPEDEFDLGAAELFDDGEMDPQAAQQLLGQIVDQRTSKAVQEAVSPLMQQIQDMQIGMDSAALVERYPDLENPEVAQPVVDEAYQRAQELGQPGLASNPAFLEVVYKAQMADKYAAGERPVGGEPQFELESAGGAGPQVSEPDAGERIVQAYKRSSFWT